MNYSAVASSPTRLSLQSTRGPDKTGVRIHNKSPAGIFTFVPVYMGVYKKNEMVCVYAGGWGRGGGREREREGGFYINDGKAF